MMVSKREAILEALMSAMQESEDLDEYFKTLGPETISKMIFFTPIRGSDSLRLSSRGYEFIQPFFEGHFIQCGKDSKFVSRDVLKLAKKTSMPYYIDSKQKFIAVFEEDLAAQLTLLGGELSMLE
jgi:hypothetical protein